MYEMGWITGTTVDMVCSMGLMLTSVSEVFGDLGRLLPVSLRVNGG